MAVAAFLARSQLFDWSCLLLTATVTSSLVVTARTMAQLSAQEPVVSVVPALYPAMSGSA